MQNELRRLRALFAHALAFSVVGCGGSSDETTTNTDCTQACQCYSPPAPEVVRKPYAPRCAAAADAGDAGDAGDASDVGDASDACEEFYLCDQVCGSSPSGGFRMATCREIRNETSIVEIECTYMSPPCGRMTDGQGSIDAPRDVASWLSSAAWLEASAVEAFERLTHELSFHRAPRALVREASRAARDEIRHARVMAALARREGRVPRAPSPSVLPMRSLEALALENAVEGCVRETFGALLATHQARYAEDRMLRASFARIAADETRHAALAHAIDRWATRRLPVAARKRIARARIAASRELAHELRVQPTLAMQRKLGLPTASVARAMAVAMAGPRARAA